jgi:transcriptional regulator with XRE-family HTH domain
MGKLAVLAGANIRRLRRAKKLSLERLAAQCDMDVKYLGQIERGEANCTLAMVEKIAEALAIEAAELLRPLPAPASRPPDLATMIARLDESVSQVREAAAPYIIAAAPRPRKRSRRR